MFAAEAVVPHLLHSLLGLCLSSWDPWCGADGFELNTLKRSRRKIQIRSDLLFYLHIYPHSGPKFLFLWRSLCSNFFLIRTNLNITWSSYRTFWKIPALARENTTLKIPTIWRSQIFFFLGHIFYLRVYCMVTAPAVIISYLPLTMTCESNLIDLTPKKIVLVTFLDCRFDWWYRTISFYEKSPHLPVRILPSRFPRYEGRKIFFWV